MRSRAASQIRVLALSILCASLVAAGQGCVSIGGGTWSAPQSVTLKLDPASLHSLDVRTVNGAIEFTGGGEAEPVVIATKRGMGHDAEAADAALRDIQVFVKADDRGGQSIGWRWATEPKPADWQAEVAFKIKAPPRLNLVLETHNGTIDVNGVSGEIRAISHNGAISTSSRGEGLDALTYNGEIHAVYDGPRISLATHNGTIHADLEHCATLAGKIESKNGGIIVTIGSKTSADWDCHTANGQVRFDPPADNATTADRHFRGRTAAGGTPVVLNSQNGEIHVRAGRQ
jgi:DUF4097 and DUF4098 domain-containing protein YvlB